MDAKEFLKKKKEYCIKNDCVSCSIRPTCFISRMTEAQMDEQIKFFETKKSTCPTCGAPVEVCGGVTRFEKDRPIYYDKIVYRINQLWVPGTNMTFINSIKQA